MRVLDRPMILASVAVAGMLAMSGCATHPGSSHEVYTSVDKLVPVSCVPVGLGSAPTGLLTPVQIAAIPDGPTRYVAIARDWMLRVARMNDTEPVIGACRTTANAP